MQKHLKLATLGWLVVCGACSGGGGGGGGAAPPATSAPNAPTNITVAPSDQANTIAWTAAPTATVHHLYFAVFAGVTPQNGTKLANVTSPFLHAGLTNGQPVFYVVTAANAAGESAASFEVSATPASPSGPDPLYGDQWHLENVGQLGGKPGEDANVRSVLDEGLTGANVRIAIVDDGLEIAHEDLAANIVPGASFNYLNGSTDPTGGEHGTSVAGVAAAVGANGLGVTGAAPRAELVGYNFLANPTTFNEADAMTRGGASIAISNNSWGPVSNGNLAYASQSWFSAISAGLLNGRGGLGTIYLFAGGNSGGEGENTNDSDFSNHSGVVTVAAVGDDGRQATYSEPGASVLIAAPSWKGDASAAITTADRTGALGYNPTQCPGDHLDQAYTRCFSGTSSATPLAAGCVALMLEANPALTWRDVRKVLAYSARLNDPGDSDWTFNGAGHAVNHKYGFGVVDARAAVDLARAWPNLPASKLLLSAPSNPGLPIPDSGAGGPVADSIAIAGSGISRIESVIVSFSASDHPYASDLDVILVSPSGTASVLAESHLLPPGVGPGAPFDDWTFSSVRHLDESADGTWTLTVSDGVTQDEGTFESWQLFIAGI